MRCGLLLLLTLAALSPLQPCVADEAPARPVPAAKKKAAPVQIQIFQPRQVTQDTDDSKSNDPAAGLVLANRMLTVRLTRAREALAAQRFSDAIQALQSLLDSQEDGAFYIDSEKRSGLRSIKLEAERLLGTMPPAGRKAYEFQFGMQAQQMLEAAMDEGNVVLLAEISRRHFHTQAGFEATYLLGASHLDHGQPLAAALCFERLRRNSADRHHRHSMLCLKSAIAWFIAGMPQPAQASLIELKQSDPDFTFAWAGREVKLFDDDAQADDWLKSLIGSLGKKTTQTAMEWPMVRGDASRTASSTGQGPVLDAVWKTSTSSWSVSAEDAPFFGGVVNVALQIEELAGDFQKRNEAAIPGPHPLIIENVVLARTVDRLQAFDLASGDLLWETPGDTVLERLRNGTAPPLPGDRGSLLDPLLLQRVFTDSTYGSLSADGGIVFCIEGLGYSSTETGNMFGQAKKQPPHPLATKPHNRLVAYSIRSGKLTWQKGGPADGSTLGLAGHFFLGPPLPLAHKAYCLAETAGQIRLAVLDSETGKVDWSQPLHSVPTSVIENERRAKSGLSPSYADGVMICPTGAGIVVALDVATRRLMWSYRYREPEDDNPRNRMRALAIARMAAQRRGNSAGISKPSGYWLDSLAAIINGRVILTPRDSDEMHCVNLMDGSLVWKKPRNGRLYVGGVYDGKLLLVGSQQLELLRIGDGGAVWSEPTKFPLLSGRGVLSGNRYHVPLSTAAFATIDLDNGRIVASQKSADGIVPGNLVFSGGHVIAQGTASLVCFKQKKPSTLEAPSE